MSALFSMPGKRHGLFLRLIALAIVLGTAACETAPKEAPPAPLRDFGIRSILVLPPVDDTFEVSASYAYLPTVTRPLAERGYYVFPVAVVDRMMRENGLPGPAEMQTVSLKKLNEIFGADAVLYLTLTDWGSSYKILSSDTQVTVQARLVDSKSGAEIWKGEASATESSANGSSNKLSELLLAAVVRQVFSSVDDGSEEVARRANFKLFWSSKRGLPPGPYHPDFNKGKK